MILVPRADIFGPATIPTNNNGSPRPAMKGDRRYALVHYTGVNMAYRFQDLAPAVRTIEAFASGPTKRTPWEYNYVIHQDGRVAEYAGLYRAAHCAYFNDESYGILMLNGTQEPLTDAQIGAYHELRTTLRGGGALSPNSITDPHMAHKATACPGNLVLVRFNELRSEAPPTHGGFPPFDPVNGLYSLYPIDTNKSVLVQGSAGDPVRYLQAVLAQKANQAYIVIDGLFGPTTMQGVVNLQAWFGLTVDGRVGPQTWAKIDELAAT